MRINGRPIRCNPSSCLIINIPVPLRYRTFPRGKRPLLKLDVSISSTLLRQLIDRLRSTGFRPLARSRRSNFYLASMGVTASVLRDYGHLVLTLRARLSAGVLNRSLLARVICHILANPRKRMLFGLTRRSDRCTQITGTVGGVRRSCTSKLAMRGLTRRTGVDISTFRSTFHGIALRSPLRCLGGIHLGGTGRLVRLRKQHIGSTTRSMNCDDASRFDQRFGHRFGVAPGKYIT